MSTAAASRIITARFAGTCTACKGSIRTGEQMRHEGRGLAYHVACQSTGAAPLPPAARSYGRRPYRSGSYTRFAGGGESYRNARGRCEDAPCCGCCS